MPARRRGNSLDLHALPYAAAAIGLGAMTLLWRDFPQPWQSVPAIAHRGSWIFVTGALLVVAGLLALLPRTGHGRLLLPLLYLCWAIGLELPPLIAHLDIANLLDLAEPLALAAGGAALCLGQRAGVLRTILRVTFGLCMIAFGIGHALHPATISAWIPAMLPKPLYWAYAVAGAQMLAGLAITLARAGDTAATLLGLVYGLIAAIVDAPPVWHAPKSRSAWTVLLLATATAGAAWLARGIAGKARRAKGFSGR